MRQPSNSIIAVFTLLGVAIGLLLAQLVCDGDTETSFHDDARPLDTSPEPTQAPMVLVTNTFAPTDIPTLRPTDAPTPASGINDCGTATPGGLCAWPPAPTATATAYLSCAGTPTPEALCRWEIR
jgi:hypothetical protein